MTEKSVFLYLSVHWGDLIEQIKKICHIHFNQLHYCNNTLLITVMKPGSPDNAILDCEQSLSFPSIFRAIEGTSRERTSDEW